MKTIYCRCAEDFSTITKNFIESQENGNPHKNKMTVQCPFLRFFIQPEGRIYYTELSEEKQRHRRKITFSIVILQEGPCE